MIVVLKCYGCKAVHRQVSTLQEASEEVRKYIDEYDLGARTLEGGTVKINNKKIANVSYNGRVWTPQKYPNCTEITGAALTKVYQ